MVEIVCQLPRLHDRTSTQVYGPEVVQVAPPVVTPCLRPRFPSLFHRPLQQTSPSCSFIVPHVNTRQVYIRDKQGLSWHLRDSYPVIKGIESVTGPDSRTIHDRLIRTRLGLHPPVRPTNSFDFSLFHSLGTNFDISLSTTTLTLGSEVGGSGPQKGRTVVLHGP